MKNTSLKKINEFIGMYDMRDVLTVRGCDWSISLFQVNHQIGEDENIYVCKTLNDAAHCVNCIIFNLPIDASRTGEVT
jgi:hypothetical protein